MRRIYLDNASSSPLTDHVKEVLIKSYEDHFGNPSSIHHHGRVSRSLLEQARKKIANAINASVGEIFFTSSATEANNMILKRSIIDLNVDHIITSPTEHPCVLKSVEAIKFEHPEVEITLLKVDNKGNINLLELESLLQNSNKTTLVSLMYANNEIATLHDVVAIGQMCKNHGALYHSDVVQAIGKRPIDVSKTYFSFLTSSAHKYHGPKGVGFFYMNMDNIITPMIHGGAQERNMRAGTENLHSIIAMSEALQESLDNIEDRRMIHCTLKNHFIHRLLTEFDDIKINGETETSKAIDHIVSVSFPPTDRVDMLMFNLDISGVSASSGSACSSGIESDSPVLLAIGHPSERKTIRFSFSHMTTLEEIDLTIEILKKHTPTV